MKQIYQQWRHNFFDNNQKPKQQLLNAAAYPAKCFAADAKIRSYIAKWYPFYNMWPLLQQLLVAFCGCFKLGIYKPFLQSYIILLIRNPQQPFYFMVLV